jgi:orotate phosphoribosyltransferase
MNFTLDETMAEAGFIKRGHFVLKSGYHSNVFFNFGEVAHKSKLINQIGRELSCLVGWQDIRDTVVIGAETLGRTLSTHTAAHPSGTVHGIWYNPADFNSDDPKNNPLKTPRYDFSRFVQNNQDVVFVDDVLTKGTTLRGAQELVERFGGHISTALFVARRDRSVTAESLGLKQLSALIELDAEDWPPDKCPLCKNAVPINPTKHGVEFCQETGYPLSNE